MEILYREAYASWMAENVLYLLEAQLEQMSPVRTVGEALESLKVNHANLVNGLQELLLERMEEDDKKSGLES